MIDSYNLIRALIKGTNNGKLLRDRIPREAREAIPALIGLGLLAPATFIHALDSVRMP